ncbi:MAG TPA: D-arabinono-1,4-lactone oxidase [Oligoflexus sp.]|uniref:D-arabinono-1,4-lactone oxidase n=1 Tax=Oligoflexus sp. TaxID=1971216 RepID=UPI002D3206E6|nr:D-arabinono-1,4-lactone oxidase [Oligoflexus sp.]HYX34708.1 D-arabinono-1,4-lactone oxidase [Oligoflexus sp.]
MMSYLFRYLVMSCCFLSAGLAFADAGLRTLYVTDFNNRYHNYNQTQKNLQKILYQNINLDLTVVGRKSKDSLDLLKKPGFLQGYQLFIYNACFADNTDLALLRNLNQEIRSSGVPTVFLHCAMHNFRWSSTDPGVHGLGKTKRLKKSWSKAWPQEEFPAFWQLTGMDTVNHDLIGPFTVDKVGSHPIIRNLPEHWTLARDERYQTLKLQENVIPLLKSGNHTVAWLHQAGKAKIFATTLGHDDNTQLDPKFAELLSRGIFYITGYLNEAGEVDPQALGQKIFANYSGSIQCYPQSIVEPENLEAVQAAVRLAAERQLKIKVVSIDKPNSYSEILCPEKGGLLINVKHLNRILAVDPKALTVTVEPGVTVEALGQALHLQGLSFATTADYTGITIAGGIATAAHHSSLTLPVSMSEYVEALELVDAQGELHRYTGAEARRYATHLGVLGVVTQITLRVEPEFKLQYGYEAESDESLEHTIETLVRQHSYGRVSWFAGAGRYVLEYFDKVPVSKYGDSENNLWSSTAGAFRWVGDLPYTLINAGPRILQCTGEAIRSRVWLAPVKNVGSDDWKRPVGFAYKMLGSACAAGKCPWDYGAKNRSIEVAIPLSQLKNWMQDVRQVLAKDHGCFPVLGLYLRFSPAAESWMSMARGEDTVMFEIHIPTVDKQDIFEQSVQVYDEILQLSLHKYQGRPHWGKNSRPVFTGVGERYPDWHNFLKVQKNLDPQGLFENDFFRSLKGKDVSLRYPACARSHDCFCEADSDCGTGYVCRPGLEFSEARVCLKP